ncbi:MAG: PilZ domain-containing protein [Myxococcota bacterium]
MLRTSERTEVLLKACEAALGPLKSSLVMNLSAGGVFLRTESPPPVGTLLRLMLEIPGDPEPLEVDAEVRWSATELQAPYSGVGLAFQRVTPKNEARLKDILVKLEPGPSTPARPQPRWTMRLLLLERQPIMRAVFLNHFTRLSKSTGWQVDLMGADDLSEVRKTIRDRRIDLAIVDLDHETAEHVRQLLNVVRSDSRHARTPVILLGSGDPPRGDVFQKDTMFFRKPITMLPLMGVLRLVGEHHAGGS